MENDLYTQLLDLDYKHLNPRDDGKDNDYKGFLTNGFLILNVRKINNTNNVSIWFYNDDPWIKPISSFTKSDDRNFINNKASILFEGYIDTIEDYIILLNKYLKIDTMGLQIKVLN